MFNSRIINNEMLDFYIQNLRDELDQAYASDDQSEVDKISKQIELLDDAIVIYKITREQ